MATVLQLSEERGAQTENLSCWSQQRGAMVPGDLPKFGWEDLGPGANFRAPSLVTHAQHVAACLWGRRVYWTGQLTGKN